MSTILRVVLDADLGEEPRRMIQEQVSYLDEAVTDVELDGDTLRVVTSHPVEGLQSGVQELVDRTVRSFRRVTQVELVSHDPALVVDRDPEPALIARGDLVHVGHGMASFQGRLLAVMDGLDRVFAAEGHRLGGVEQRHPTTVPAASLSANGYLKSFPHHAILAAPARPGIDSLRAVGDGPDAEGTYPSSAMDRPAQVLAPTVCHHTFEWLRGRNVASSPTILTAVGRCHRHEGAATDGLRRLQTFTMREIVVVAGADEVTDIRQGLIDHAVGLTREWGLRARVVTASDPFFASTEDRKRAYQSMMKLKYELQLWLPYAGEWLACASFNHHQSSLVDVYDITDADERVLHSGCVGYGLERWALAINAQHGTDDARWPTSLRDVLAGSDTAG